jgi:hypothetical protein
MKECSILQILVSKVNEDDDELSRNLLASNPTRRGNPRRLLASLAILLDAPFPLSMRESDFEDNSASAGQPAGWLSGSDLIVLLRRTDGQIGRIGTENDYSCDLTRALDELRLLGKNTFAARR